MFEKRKRNKRYRELMENGSIYNIKEFIISVYNREEILNKEQIYNLLLKVQLDSNTSTNLLIKTDLIHFTTQERLILLNSIVEKDIENVSSLINYGFMFSKTELDLIVGAVIRNKSAKVAKLLCEKYALPTEIDGMLSSIAVMNILKQK